MEVGKTHDVIVHVNDSLAVGFVIRPHSYRTDHQPTMIPSFGQGDPTGLDTSRWKSFVQQSFFQGAGQYFWSSAHANAGFAESDGWDIARPVTIDDVILQYDPSWQYGENLAPTGQAQVSVFPRSMTAGCLQAKQFSADYPIFLREMSGNPHILHMKNVFVYTCHPDSRTWAQGLTSPATLGATGKWQCMEQVTSLTSPIVHVTMFSGAFVVADEQHSIRVIDNSGVHTPGYNTLTNKLIVYDAKIWRSYRGQVAYLDPADNTSPWSTYYTPVDMDIPVVNMETFGGRLYFGTETHLAVFDAGVVYPVQSWAQERSENNFKLLVNHYGALYFNIGNKLMRYTGAGVFEQIRTPVFNNNIIDGVSIGSDLIFLIQGAGVYQVWVFNADTGGCYQWFSEKKQVAVDNVLAMADAPTMLDALRGRIFIAPMYMTGQVHPGDTTITPILVANRVPSSDVRLYPGSRIVTSSYDFGRPAMDKQYNRLIVDHRMDTGSFLDVEVSISPRQLPRMAGAAQAQDITAVEHSTVGYYDLPRTLQTGQFLAYFLAQPVQDFKLSGVVYMTPSNVTAALQAQYSIAGAWRDIPNAAIQGDQQLFNLDFQMFQLTDWISDVRVPAMTQFFYGLRFRHIPTVPGDNTLAISSTTQSVVTFANILKIDGRVVVGQNGKVVAGE